MKTEWAHKKLIDLADYYNGMAFKPSDWVESGTKIIRIEQLNNPLGNYDYYQGSYPEINAIHNEDLIFSWSATLKVAIWKWGEGVLNQHLFKVVPFENVDKYFLYYLLDYNMPKLGESSHGSTMKHIKRKELETYSVKIPTTLSAQRRIAAILSSADKVIDSTRRLIEKYKKMKQGMMEDLLKPKDGWKMVRLGEVCEPSSEKYNPLTENTFQYCIEMENINQESGTINGKSDITKLLSLKTKFHKGEVLYGKLRPYLKKYWLSDFDGACSTEIWVLKNSENIDNQFLFYLFQSDCINRIANQSSGTKMPRADWNFMEKQTVSIPFKNDKPDLPEQRRIAAILSGIDAKIAAEEKVLEKYGKVKKGLMERMLEENKEK